MKAVVAAVALFTFSLAANAEIGLGVIGRYHLSDQYASTSDVPGESLSVRSGFSFGALVFLPLAPLFSLRTGFDIEQMKVNDTFPGQDSDKTTSQNLLIPVDVQFDILETGLYAYAGGILVATISHSSDAPAGSSGGDFNTRPDLRFDIGAGYNVLSLGPVKLGVELEYMKGLFNISPNPSASIRTQSLTANLLARFTL